MLSQAGTSICEIEEYAFPCAFHLLSLAFSRAVSDLLFTTARYIDDFDEVRGSVLKTSVDGTEIATIADTSFGTLATGLIYAMDYDLDSGLLYFADRNTSTLWSVPLERLTSSQDGRILVLEGVKAWGLSYDWVNGYLYWTDDR